MKSSSIAHPARMLIVLAASAAPSLGFTQAAASDVAKQDYQLSYQSALTGYEPYREQKVNDWRQANDKVGEIGGWRAYAKEMRMAAPASGQEQPAPGHDAHQKEKK